jgi:hypothetical protein
MPTPLEFADKYYSLNVTVPASTPTSAPVSYTVRIDKYRINAASSHHCDLAEKDILVSKVREAIKKAKPGDLSGPQNSDITAIANAFFAKGSPADFATALRCAVLCKRTDATKLQQYANEHLGLDCSGFINQYWIADGSLAAGGSRVIDDYGKANRRRSLITSDTPADPAAVQAKDMLIWPDFGHIAIIDHLSITKNTSQAVVVESTAHAFKGMSPGLVHTTYDLKSVDSKTKKFSVLRGGATVDVYIASFNPVSTK